MIDAVSLRTCCGKWGLKSGVLTIGAFTTMSSLSYFLFFLTNTAADDPPQFVRAHIAFSLLTVILCASLFVAGIKENRMLLIPYLVIKGSFIVAISSLLLPIALVEPIVLLSLLILAPLIYCWLIVYSYYLELDPMRALNTNNQVIAYTAPQPIVDQMKQPEIV